MDGWMDGCVRAYVRACVCVCVCVIYFPKATNVLVRKSLSPPPCVSGKWHHRREWRSGDVLQIPLLHSIHRVYGKLPGILNDRPQQILPLKDTSTSIHARMAINQSALPSQASYLFHFIMRSLGRYWGVAFVQTTSDGFILLTIERHFIVSDKWFMVKGQGLKLKGQRSMSQLSYSTVFLTLGFTNWS